MIELPLFASEKAAQVGMSVIDIVYAAPAGGLGTLDRQRFGLPDLGLNVGKVEWTVHLPVDYRLTAVGGNLDRPVSAPPPVRGLAARLVRAAAGLFRGNTRRMAVLGLVTICLAGAVLALLALSRLFDWSPRQVLTRVAFLLVVVVVLAAVLRPAPERARRQARVSSEASNLHNIGLALLAYRGQHDGRYPPDLQALVDTGVLKDPQVLTSPEDAQLVYSQPRPNAAPTDVMAYFYHPDSGGANLLFADGSTRWVAFEGSGNLLSPLKAGAPIATAGGRAAPSGKRSGAFAPQGVSTEELAEALQLGQQMAGPAGGPVANQPVDMSQLNEALVVANRDKILDAKDAYAKEHGGRQPESPAELSDYIADARLRQAMREGGIPTPALERARPAANSPAAVAAAARAGGQEGREGPARPLALQPGQRLHAARRLRRRREAVLRRHQARREATRRPAAGWNSSAGCAARSSSRPNNRPPRAQ